LFDVEKIGPDWRIPTAQRTNQTAPFSSGPACSVNSNFFYPTIYADGMLHKSFAFRLPFSTIRLRWSITNNNLYTYVKISKTRALLENKIFHLAPSKKMLLIVPTPTTLETSSRRESITLSNPFSYEDPSHLHEKSKALANNPKKRKPESSQRMSKKIVSPRFLV
jgi:hypothetical protein